MADQTCSTSTDCKNVEDCIAKGHCTAHDVEIERRVHTTEKVTKLEVALETLTDKFEEFIIENNEKLNGTNSRVLGLAGSLGLILIIVMGGYYYTNLVDVRNDRGEEILLSKINANSTSDKEERAHLVGQVVDLLTADAAQRQWQEGMMTQLELLNRHIRDIVDLKYDAHETGENKRNGQ